MRRVDTAIPGGRTALDARVSFSERQGGVLMAVVGSRFMPIGSNDALRTGNDRDSRGLGSQQQERHGPNPGNQGLAPDARWRRIGRNGVR